MANSGQYGLIVNVMNYRQIPSRAIEATYEVDGDGTIPRKFLPYLLGVDPAEAETSQENETVLCYQYAGPRADSEPGFRCLKVKKLDADSMSIIPFDYLGVVPPPLDFRDVQRQSCVVDVREWRRNPYSS